MTPPSERPPDDATLSLETFEQIEKAIIDDKLGEALQLLRQAPGFRSQSILLLASYNHYKNRKDKGLLSPSADVLERNNLRNRLVSIIEPSMPADHFDSKQKEQKWRTAVNRIEGPEDRLLLVRLRLLGRDRELAQVLARLHDPTESALLIVGAGGIGKTAFCKTLLKQYLQQQPTRPVYWIGLEYMNDLQALLSALAQVLGLPDNSKPRKVLKAVEDSKGLFYLDNLESLSGKEGLRQLLENFKYTNGVQWLASSREELGDWPVFKIKELAIDSALAVFMEQWRQSGGEDIEATHPGLRRFVDKDLGRHPLSLILTASRAIDFIDLEELMKAWQTGYEEVAKKFSGDKEHRLNSLSVSQELSWASLGGKPNARRLWALCAFFPEGMDKAALHYFNESNIANANDRAILIRRSIMSIEKRRLNMLPPFARFILQKLEEGDQDISEKQLFEDGLGFALQYAPKDHVARGEEGTKWLKKLPFIFQFLYYFSQKLEKYPALLELADLMMNYYDRNIHKGRQVLQRLIAAKGLQRLKNKRNRDTYAAQFRENLGDLEFHLGDNEAARRLWMEAIELYNKIDSKRGLVNCQDSLGDLELLLGNNEAARQLWTSALQLNEQLGYDLGRANSQMNLGRLEFRLGHAAKARAFWKEALQGYENIRSDLGQANCQVYLGRLAQKEGNYTAARTLANAAEDLYEQVESIQGQANCKVDLGQVFFAEGQDTKAQKVWEEAMALFQQTGDDEGRADCKRHLSRLKCKQGKLEEAIALCKEALEVDREVQHKQNQAQDLLYMGRCYAQHGVEHWPAARRCLAEALELAEALQAHYLLLEIREVKEGLEK
ncbi:MAG: tetratricopeptide repeat protein [Bacteroidota bacterium]